MNALARLGSGIASVTRTTFSAAAAAGSSFAMVFAKGVRWGSQLIFTRTNIDFARQVGDPMHNSAVVAVVGWIARNFPDAPVRVAKLASDGTRTYVQMGQTGAGWMLHLLERPNQYFSGVLLWTATIVDLYTTGNGYWLKVRNASGRIVELWWAPAKTMMPRGDENTFIDHYEYNPNGTIYKIDPANVVHYRYGINPDNPRLGRSPLMSVLREIYTDDEGSNFSAQLLTNLGVPGVVIAPSNTNTGAIRGNPENVKQKFIETFGGDRRGDPLVLTAPTDVKVLSFSPDQMNLRDLRKLPEERISAVVGVAAIVAGLGAGLDRSTFSNYGEARAAAYEEAIIPQQRLIAAEMEIQLLDEFVNLTDGWDVDFDLSKVRALAAYIEANWRRHESAATKGLITRRAFKEATNQPATADDDVYVLPSNYMLLDPANDPVNAPAAAGGQYPPAAIKPPGKMGGLLLPGTEVVATAGEFAGEVRCSECNRLLAEKAAPPYRITCSRCKTVAELAA